MSGTSGLLRQIGLRHSVERPLRTALTAGGIAAGVALVFSITSMNAALNDTVRSTVGAFAGPADLQVTAVSAGALDENLAAELRVIPGVSAVAPVLQARSELSANGHSAGAFVLGGTVDLVAFAPRTDTAVDLSGIAIGVPLARRLQVQVGQHITVSTPTGPLDLPVRALLPEGPLDRINGGLVAVLPLAAAQQMFERPGEVDLLLIGLGGDRPVDEVRGDITRTTGSAGIVTAPEDAPGARSENVQPFLLLSEAIGLISLFVALVLVFNTMSMAMAERRGELALAAALGARRRQLLVGVLGEAAALGLVGTAVGLAGGALLADQLLRMAGDAYRTVLPIDPPTGAVLVGPHLVIAALGGVAVAVLGAALPARRVLRTAPIAALRPANDYEWTPDADEHRRLAPTLGALALLAVGVGLGVGTGGSAPSLGRSALIVVAILAGITTLLPAALPLVADRIGNGLERQWGVVGRLAGDALRANPRRTSITLATLILPLATVIGMGTAFSSAQAGFHRLAETFVATPIVVTADSFVGYTAMQPLREDAAGLLEKVPGVRVALPTQNAFLTTNAGLVIVYITPMSIATRAGVSDALDDASNADNPAAFRAGLMRGEVAVSRLAARNRGLGAGDALTLPTAHGPATFRVATLFDDLAGVDTLYIDRDTYQQHWPGTGVQAFGIALDDGADSMAVAAALRSAVDRAGLPAEVRERHEAVAELEAGLAGLFSVARSVQFAALVVAALSLASTAFTAVLERRWSLGLQRTLGMSRTQIARSLALEASAIAVIGAAGASVVGVGIGVLLAQSFGIIAAVHLPVVVPWLVVAASAVGALVISLVATAYPRRLATRTPIIEALVAE